MEVKKMPDFMMDYLGSIGHESINVYSEYKTLAGQYCIALDDYINRIYPVQNENYKAFNALNKKDLGDLDPSSGFYGIKEKYKRESLSIACKYGYERPNDDIIKAHEKMTEMQEKNPIFSKFIDQDKILSNEDIIAKEAHRKYFLKNPEAKKNHQAIKEGFRRLEWEEKQPDPFAIPYKPDKKVTKDYVDSRIDDFFRKLPSNQPTKDNKASHNREDRDIKRWEL